MTSSPNRPPRHDRPGAKWTTTGYQHAADVSHLGPVIAYRLIVRLVYLRRNDLAAHGRLDGTTVQDVVIKMGEDGAFLEHWIFLSKTAIGRPLSLGRACSRDGRSDLYKLCRYVLKEIDKNKPTAADVEWFPHGWEEAADLIRGDIKRQNDAEMSDDERKKLLQEQYERLVEERRAAE